MGMGQGLVTLAILGMAGPDREEAVCDERRRTWGQDMAPNEWPGEETGMVRQRQDRMGKDTLTQPQPMPPKFPLQFFCSNQEERQVSCMWALLHIMEEQAKIIITPFCQ